MTERDWIARYIRPLISAPGADNLRDDVALLSGEGVVIVTMDTLVEGVHFLQVDPIDTVGRKLVRVNVSDIIAKGALPQEALLSISWPDDRDEADFAAFIAGMAIDLETYGISLIGGDFVKARGPLSLTLTLTGCCIGNEPVRRAGGQVGDTVVVAGEIGWGHIGLLAASAGANNPGADRYRLPKIADLTAASAVSKFATASIDVSDGLFIDALQLADASLCGVSIDLERVPFANPGADLDGKLAQCTGGDDYQILMTVSGDQVPSGFTSIGCLTEEPGLSVFEDGYAVNLPVTLGFEH